MDVRRYGPWALIIGGSEGVGRILAGKLLAKGFGIVIAARKQQPLAEVAHELRATGGEVRIVSVDMSQPDALKRVRSATDGIEIGLLVHNAGANSVRGDFINLEEQVYRALVDINVVSLMEFARHYGAAMKARGRGGIITTGSTAGYMGAPGLASYCAAKAFQRVFSEALWAEGRQFAVDVLHVIMGLTATPAMACLGVDLSLAQDPKDVAQAALDNKGNGPVCITGGERILKMAINGSRIAGRADAIDAFATGARTRA